MWKLITCSASGITEPAIADIGGELADEGRDEAHVEEDGAGQANGAKDIRKHIHVRSPIILGKGHAVNDKLTSKL